MNRFCERNKNTKEIQLILIWQSTFWLCKIPFAVLCLQRVKQLTDQLFRMESCQGPFLSIYTVCFNEIDPLCFLPVSLSWNVFWWRATPSSWQGTIKHTKSKSNDKSACSSVVHLWFYSSINEKSVPTSIDDI